MRAERQSVPRWGLPLWEGFHVPTGMTMGWGARVRVAKQIKSTASPRLPKPDEVKRRRPACARWRSERGSGGSGGGPPTCHQHWLREDQNATTIGTPTQNSWTSTPCLPTHLVRVLNEDGDGDRGDLVRHLAQPRQVRADERERQDDVAAAVARVAQGLAEHEGLRCTRNLVSSDLAPRKQCRSSARRAEHEGLRCTLVLLLATVACVPLKTFHSARYSGLSVR